MRVLLTPKDLTWKRGERPDLWPPQTEWDIEENRAMFAAILIMSIALIITLLCVCTNL